jgi:hypothetical protein
MDRRRFLLTSLAGALAAPLSAEAQQGKISRIGFLGPSPSGTGVISFRRSDKGSASGGKEHRHRVPPHGTGGL